MPMARALPISRFGDFSIKPSSSSCCCLYSKPFLPSIARHLLFLRRDREPQSQRLSASFAVHSCLVSGVDGGGVADDFIHTQRSGGPAGRREYSVLANVLRGIEPLDTSVIGTGVSNPARDSMKRTISSMLGLLPSDQFQVTVRVLKEPLHRLLASSIITGYTLWNAEYRVSLMNNFNSSPGEPEATQVPYGSCEALEEEERGHKVGNSVEGCCENLGDLSPASLNYIRQLQAELATVEKELDAQKQENRHMGCNKEHNNDLLEYLRSLEPDMVTELSQPSSPEVEEIIQQLVYNIKTRFFKDEDTGVPENRQSEKTDSITKINFDECDAMDTTRDYLARLLFWCMLLGHHMRGLEHRLHLSFVVGLV